MTPQSQRAPPVTDPADLDLDRGGAPARRCRSRRASSATRRRHGRSSRPGPGGAGDRARGARANEPCDVGGCRRRPCRPRSAGAKARLRAGRRLARAPIHELAGRSRRHGGRGGLLRGRGGRRRAGGARARPDRLGAHRCPVPGVGGGGPRAPSARWRAFRAVLAALDDKPQIRRRAVIALAAIESPESEAALRRCLKDRDWQVRQAAEDVLGVTADDD